MSTPPANVPSANRQIARAAGTVMLAFIFSNLIGLLRGILILQRFGTGLEMEAFNTANRLPDTLFNLVAAGALASAFVPTFTGLLARKEERQAWYLASAVVNLVVIGLAVLSLAAAVFAPQVVEGLLAPGYAQKPAQLQLTVDLLRVMLPAATLFGISGLVMGILNAHQIFLFPALAPSMYSLGLIFGALVLAPGMGIFGLAWGALVGAALHLLVQLPVLFRLKGHYLPTLGLKSPLVHEVGRLMLPRLFSTAVVQLNFWVNTALASTQPDGSLTALNTGFTLMMMPEALIAQAIAIASLPTFSAQAALNKVDEMRSSLVAALRAVLLLSIPATVGLVLLRQPLVVFLYQRQAFTPHSTELVAWALLWYAAGLVGHSVVEVIYRAYYALHDTKTPVMIGVAAMSLNVLFSLALVRLFQNWGLPPHGGLALANSLATFLEMAAALVGLSRRLKGLNDRMLWLGVGQAVLAAVLMGLVLSGWLAFSTGRLGPAWVTLGGVLVGGSVYGAAALAMRAPELNRLYRLIRR